MTQASRARGETIAELFAASADAAVRQVLRDSGKPLVKSEILEVLATSGVPRNVADAEWAPVQKRLRQDKRVIAARDGQLVRYRWNPDPPRAPSPADALAMLVEGRLTRGEREALAETVRAALAGGGAESTDGKATESKVRQAELDAATELAGMAIDVEEQVAKGASGKAVIHRVRARMKRLRLEPVERAGESVAYDRTRHKAIRTGIAEGATVLVVRPGYVWRLPGEDLLIEKPVIQD
jgi:hypothetical protein